MHPSVSPSVWGVRSLVPQVCSCQSGLARPGRSASERRVRRPAVGVSGSDTQLATARVASDQSAAEIGR